MSEDKKPDIDTEEFEELDEDLVEQLDETPFEDPILTRHLSDTDNSELEGKDKIVNSWIPGKDDYLGKSRLSENQIQAAAVGRNYDKVFPFLDDELCQLVKDFTNDLLKGYTSLDGKSRKEQKEVLMSLSGGNIPNSENQESSISIKAFPSKDDE